MTNRRGFLKLGGAALVSGYALNTDVFAAEIDPLTLVDPELRSWAIQMRATSGPPAPLTNEALPAIRAKISSSAMPPLEGVAVAEKRIAGVAGQPDVRVYIANAKPGASRPGIVFMHGGGFIFGDAKATIREIQGLALALDCCVISVDYRLAPETIYIGSKEDNYVALLWTYRNAAELGIDLKRIAVMGESAGGGHAALLAITARDRGEVPVCFQVLVYPMLDDRTASSRQVPKFFGTFVWSADANQFGWKSFLGRSPGGRDVPVAAVPARTLDLSGLPPAFIGVGTLDLFFDEDLDYARRLADAAVPVELLVVPGVYHGFDHDPSASVSLRFNLAKRDALRRAFSRQG